MNNKKRLHLSTHALLPILLFTGLAISVLLQQLPVAIIPYYAAISLLTFSIYYLDKSAARSGTRRTPESTLHLLSLAGGWPGAIIAQQWFRHKTRKQPFRSIFWLTLLANIGILIWLQTPRGSLFMEQMLTLGHGFSNLAALD